MALPNMSNSLYVAWLRHVQASRESGNCRNPDTLVKRFLPLLDRWRVSRLSDAELAQLRSDPFYYYLMARTLHYDHVISEAVASGVKRIVGIGCGSDTRPYRFAKMLRQNEVAVLECDQPDAIRAKQRSANGWGCSDFVTYLSIDLNDEEWPLFGARLGGRDGPKTLIMMEGVSPYVNAENFRRFLGVASSGVAPGSCIAYDYKNSGVKEDFGRSGRTAVPFRLSPSFDEVAQFHRQCGLRLIDLESSAQLTRRLLPGVAHAGAPLFDEDSLTRSIVTSR
jgi:methyltransferase (TIGR00027 family)